MSTSFNHMMHPRNRYKNRKPDFAALAETYPEFRQFCAIDAKNKLSFDFHADGSVACLSRTLLKEDYGLDIEIPAECLVPRLPCRLNYVLWLQDLLLRHCPSTSDMWGIDIGTGATCIYALLGERECGWRSVATERDSDAAECAARNVKRNKLEKRIIVHKTPESMDTRIVSSVLGAHPSLPFTFCMCNPPFFDDQQLASFLPSSPSSPSQKRAIVLPTMGKRPSRPSPLSKSAAFTNEVCAPGGEVVFVGHIMEDSQTIGDTISIYSSMLGRKSSIAPLRRKLESIKCTSSCLGTLSQGRTQRWVLAWTFSPQIHLEDDTGSNNKTSSTWHRRRLLNLGTSHERQAIRFCVNVMRRLQFHATPSLPTAVDDPATFLPSTFTLVARANTWSKQRRTKRMKTTDGETTEPSPKRVKLGEEESPILTFTLRVEEGDEGEFVAEFKMVEAVNNDSLNQVIQYFKNNLHK